MELADEIEYKGYKIEVHYDQDPENPFENWDGQGKFFHWKDQGPEELIRYCELLNYDPETHVEIKGGRRDPDAVEISKYEHGNISYSVRGEGYYCRWDTSSGWAVWYPDKCLMDELKALKGAKRREKCLVYARQACELHNQWANGEVYGVISKDPSGNEIDGCWGYFGDKAKDDAIAEAKSLIDTNIKEAAKIIPAALGA